MKNNKNSNNHRAAHPSQSDEQSGNGNNHLAKFEVILGLAQWSIKHIIVEATDPDHARKIASQFDVGDFDDWEVFEDALFVESVELATGGQNNV